MDLLVSISSQSLKLLLILVQPGLLQLSEMRWDGLSWLIGPPFTPASKHDNDWYDLRRIIRGPTWLEFTLLLEFAFSQFETHSAGCIFFPFSSTNHFCFIHSMWAFLTTQLIIIIVISRLVRSIFGLFKPAKSSFSLAGHDDGTRYTFPQFRLQKSQPLNLNRQKWPFSLSLGSELSVEINPAS